MRERSQYDAPCAAALALALLTTMGCGDADPPPPTTGATTGVSWSEHNAKFAAAVAAEKPPQTVAELRTVAIDPSVTPPQRAAALRELGRQKDFESMPAVIAALDDETTEVRGE